LPADRLSHVSRLTPGPIKHQQSVFYTCCVFLTSGSRVFAVVLNYRHALDTLRCVASLRRSRDRDLHLIVVDNGSANGDADRIQTALGPAATVIANQANLGYAGGNTIGIRHALDRDADYVWVLNPDTEVEPKTLQMLMATMASNPDAGLVGSVNLVGGSDPAKVQFAGGRIDWDAGGVTETIGIGRPASEILPLEPYPVDYVAGTSMLVRRSVFADIGLLPEDYFLYFEETDFQQRAQQMGWSSYMSPLARVWHHQRSAGPVPAPYYVYYYVRGRLLFGQRHSNLTCDELEAGLAAFINGWRQRVVEHDESWVGTYDRLVRLALEDGRAGRTGYRADIADIDRARV
jgi:GT2 family glycosyltransferase